MKLIKTLALGAGLGGLLLSAAHAEGLQGKVIGFSQIGSESGWRAAETSVTKAVAAELGIDLKFADAQQKQENQIKAIRGFIAQGVDAILVAPVVATGWEEVLTEAKEAGIPVVLLDRGIEGPEDLYLTSVASDQVKEGRVAGEWLVGAVGDRQCNVVELQGTGELPGWSARYADGPVTIGESDDPAPIAGEAVLLLRLGAWMRTMDGAGYQGPKDITPTNVEAVQQVLLVDDAEGMSTWAIGLDAPRSYRVSTLTDPPRVVVDIQTEP